MGEGVTTARYKKQHDTKCYMRPKIRGAVVHSYDEVKELLFRNRQGLKDKQLLTKTSAPYSHIWFAS